MEVTGCQVRASGPPAKVTMARAGARGEDEEKRREGAATPSSSRIGLRRPDRERRPPRRRTAQQQQQQLPQQQQLLQEEQPSITGASWGTVNATESKQLDEGGTPNVQNDTPKAIGVRRAKEWNVQVEENFRLQTAGWKDIFEYRAVYGEPERWPDNDFIKCLRVKKNGYYTYWRRHREAEDRLINQVKLYEYAAP